MLAFLTLSGLLGLAAWVFSANEDTKTEVKEEDAEKEEVKTE